MTSPSEAPVLHVDLDTAGLAVVTLDRPRVLNALNRRLRHELAVCFETLAADGRTRVVILTGRGRGFCAGLDVQELAQLGLAGTGEVKDPVEALLRFPGPVIAAVNGPAITGGFELALACDVLLAAPEARFADTHLRIGVMPGWGLSQRLPRLVGPGRAKLLSWTGQPMSAAEAERWGVVQRVVPADALLASAREAAMAMLASPPEMLRAYKRLIDDGLALPFGEALAMERRLGREANARVKPQDVAARRDALFQQGRAEAAPPPETP